MSSDWGGPERGAYRDSYRNSKRDSYRDSHRDNYRGRDSRRESDGRDRRSSDYHRSNESCRDRHHSNSRYAGHSEKRWKDTYKAGDTDGVNGQTLYPVQSRTQSGTFEQHDYTKTNFKEQYGITKKPKESSTPIIKEPEYGLKWNDDESDENQDVPEKPTYSMNANSQFYDDDDVNGFKDPKKRKRRRRRGRNRSKTPEGQLSEFEKRKKEMRDRKKEEWDAVKVLPPGSGKLDDEDKGSAEEESSFSGMSGKAKWGKRQAKRRAKQGHIPIAPVMFQKAAGVLGDAVLEEKKQDKPFDLMTDAEKKEKFASLEAKVRQENTGYKYWSDEYLAWFDLHFTQKGFAKDKDPVEYLKTTETEGLTKDYASAVNGSKLRQFYLTYKIVSNKRDKAEKELQKFKEKLEGDQSK